MYLNLYYEWSSKKTELSFKLLDKGYNVLNPSSSNYIPESQRIMCYEDVKKTMIEITDEHIIYNEVNGVDNIDINTEYIVKQYFTNFVYNCLYNPQYVYDEIVDTSLNQSFKTIEEFKNFIDIVFKEKNIIIKNFHEEHIEDHMEYSCTDGRNNIYTFYEYSLNNYKVVIK